MFSDSLAADTGDDGNSTDTESDAYRSVLFCKDKLEPDVNRRQASPGVSAYVYRSEQQLVVEINKEDLQTLGMGTHAHWTFLSEHHSHCTVQSLVVTVKAKDQSPDDTEDIGNSNLVTENVTNQRNFDFGNTNIVTENIPNQSNFDIGNSNGVTENVTNKSNFDIGNSNGVTENVTNQRNFDIGNSNGVTENVTNQSNFDIGNSNIVTENIPNQSNFDIGNSNGVTENVTNQRNFDIGNSNGVTENVTNQRNFDIGNSNIVTENVTNQRNFDIGNSNGVTENIPNQRNFDIKQNPPKTESRDEGHKYTSKTELLCTDELLFNNSSQTEYLCCFSETRLKTPPRDTSVDTYCDTVTPRDTSVNTHCETITPRDTSVDTHCDTITSHDTSVDTHCDTPRDTSVDTYCETITQRDTSVDTHCETITPRDTSVDTHCETITQRDTSVDTHCETITQRDTSVDTHCDTITSRDTSVDTYCDTITPRDTSVDTHCDTITPRDTSVDTHCDTITSRDTSVDTYCDTITPRDKSVDTHCDTPRDTSLVASFNNTAHYETIRPTRTDSQIKADTYDMPVIYDPPQTAVEWRRRCYNDGLTPTQSLSEDHRLSNTLLSRSLSEDHRLSYTLLSRSLSEDHRLSNTLPSRSLSEDHTPSETLLSRSLSEDHTPSETLLSRSLSEDHTPSETLLSRSLSEDHTPSETILSRTDRRVLEVRSFQQNRALSLTSLPLKCFVPYSLNVPDRQTSVTRMTHVSSGTPNRRILPKPTTPYNTPLEYNEENHDDLPSCRYNKRQDLEKESRASVGDRVPLQTGTAYSTSASVGDRVPLQTGTAYSTRASVGDRVPLQTGTAYSTGRKKPSNQFGFFTRSSMQASLQVPPLVLLHHGPNLVQLVTKHKNNTSCKETNDDRDKQEYCHKKSYAESRCKETDNDHDKLEYCHQKSYAESRCKETNDDRDKREYCHKKPYAESRCKETNDDRDKREYCHKKSYAESRCKETNDDRDKREYCHKKSYAESRCKETNDDRDKREYCHKKSYAESRHAFLTEDVTINDSDDEIMIQKRIKIEPVDEGVSYNVHMYPEISKTEKVKYNLDETDLLELSGLSPDIISRKDEQKSNYCVGKKNMETECIPDESSTREHLLPTGRNNDVTGERKEMNKLSQSIHTLPISSIFDPNRSIVDQYLEIDGNKSQIDKSSKSEYMLNPQSELDAGKQIFERKFNKVENRVGRRSKTHKIFYCFVCKQHIRRKCYFEQHLNRVHDINDNHSFRCLICGNQFPGKSTLQEHIDNDHTMNHSNLKAKVCPYCGEIIAESASYEAHVYEHNSKLAVFVCSYPECQKRIIGKSNLNQHISKIHSTTKLDKRKKATLRKEINYKDRQFPCTWPNCGKSFVAKRNLIIHMRIHNDEKPVVCQYCDYRCRQTASLNWHLMKHGINKYDKKIGKTHSMKSAIKTSKDLKEKKAN